MLSVLLGPPEIERKSHGSALPVKYNSNEMSDQTNDKVEEVKEAVAEKVEETKEAVVEGAADAKDTTKDVMENVGDSAKDALTTIGNVFKKAGEAAVNLAETVTKTDLNKDGKIGE